MVKFAVVILSDKNENKSENLFPKSLLSSEACSKDDETLQLCPQI